MRNAAAHRLDLTLAAFAPLMEAARVGAANATKNALKARGPVVELEPGTSGRRRTVLVSLLTAGATAGAAGAMMARRRNRARWEEYESQGASGIGGARESVLDTTKSTVDTGVPKGTNVPGSAAESTGATMSGGSTTSSGSTISGSDTANLFAEQSEPPVSKNNRT
jgi:hypothetical protein